MRFQTIMNKQRIGDSGRCEQYIQIVYVYVCMWSHSHYIAQEVSAYSYAMWSVIIIFLGVVTPPHKPEWMRKGSYMNTREKHVVVGGQHNDMHSP